MPRDWRTPETEPPAPAGVTGEGGHTPAAPAGGKGTAAADGLQPDEDDPQLAALRRLVAMHMAMVLIG